MNYCVSILIILLTASPLQASENDQSLEKLKEKYHNPIYKQLEEVTKERDKLYLDKCNLVHKQNELLRKFEAAAQEQVEGAQKVEEQLTALKADHTNGKCVPIECFKQIKQQNEKLEATLDQAQKETIKTTIVTQPTTNTNQLLLTVGATTLAVSFIMHLRYHAGNFSWVVDKLLPWNYLNLR